MVGIFSRLYVLGEKAFHHDESIHCYYSYELATEGRYKGADNKEVTFGYNPVYHGPFLYHLGALFFFVFGDNDFTARLPYAVFGILLIWMVWETRKLVGVPMAIGMMAAVILSPIVNYYSRFARHDVYSGTLFFGVALYAALYLKQGKPWQLILSFLCLVLGYATKEDSYIYGFSLGFFVLVWGAYRLVRYGKSEYLSWFERPYPFLVLLVLYACFSFFVFLFVAVDYRVNPQENNIITGLYDISRNAFSLEKGTLTGPELRSKIQSQPRYFTAPDRSFAKWTYITFAFTVSILLLILMEFLRYRGSGKRSSPPEGGRGRNLVPWLTACFVMLFLVVCLMAFQSFIPFFLALLAWMVLEYIRRTFFDPDENAKDKGWLVTWFSPWLLVASSLAIGVIVFVFLFTQMFADVPGSRGGRSGIVKGIYDYIEYWFGHQMGEYRLHGPWWYYLARLIIYEFMFLIIGIVGILVVGLRRLYLDILKRSGQLTFTPAQGPFTPFFTFILWLTFFNTAIYAVLHEKVPWLAFHQAYPWAMLAGGLVAWSLTVWRYRIYQIFVGATVGCLVLLTIRFHILVNFTQPDSVNELVSQQQAERDVRDLVKLVDQIAVQSGKYEELVVASEDEVEWPFPWYFRHYKNYRVKQATADAYVQFGDDSTFKEMRVKLGDKYVYRKYLHRGAWIENSMSDGDLPGGPSLKKNILAYYYNKEFKGKPFRRLFWEYFFHRIRWGEINPKYGYVYIRKDVLPTLEPLELPKGSLDRPIPISANFETNGPASLSFRVPRGLQSDYEGNLHIVDSLNGRVVVWSATGEFVRQYGSPGSESGQLKVDPPWGASSVAIDKEGNAYVADTWNHRVVKFDRTGNPILSWGSFFEGTASGVKFFGPRGIAVGPDNRVYVADTGECEIEVFDTNGQPLKKFGSRGQRMGQLDEPVGLAFGTNGNLYVADTGNERLQIFSPEGHPLDSWQVVGWSADKVGMEPFITVLADGRVVVTLSKKKMIRVYGQGGKQVSNYMVSGAQEPIGIASDRQGNLWVSDRISSKVFRFTLSAN